MRPLRPSTRPGIGNLLPVRVLLGALGLLLGLLLSPAARAVEPAASAPAAAREAVAHKVVTRHRVVHRRVERVERVEHKAVHRVVHRVVEHPVEHRPVRRVVHRRIVHRRAVPHRVARRTPVHRPQPRRVVVHAPEQASARPAMLHRPLTELDADPVSLASGSALVVDARTHQVLLSKDAGDVRRIASLTKLMTAAVVLDAHQPMDQRITITDADSDTLKWSSSRLRPGMVFTREELLKLALMSSENRAAHALARAYPGGVDACVQAMNRKAASLGMIHTRYVEPTGLSPQNESTASDLARLASAVYAYPLIREFTTHPKSTVVAGRRELQYRNTDHLIFNRGWDILLQKTGYINEAGHCLVLNTVVQGRNVIVVLLDAWGGRYAHFVDAERIRNWMQTSGRTLLTRVDPIPAPDSGLRASLDD